MNNVNGSTNTIKQKTWITSEYTADFDILPLRGSSHPKRCQLQPEVPLTASLR